MERLKIKSSHIIGKGLFTTSPLKKGDFVDYIHGPIIVFRNITPAISKKMINWIGVGKMSWIDTSGSIFRFINHSCDPNVAITGKRKVVAIKDIPANTEITMDYSFTEAEAGWKLDRCVCRAKQCRKTIGPIWTLPDATFEKNKKYIPKNFQIIYKNYLK